jgi:hypothetical protein
LSEVRIFLGAPTDRRVEIASPADSLRFSSGVNEPVIQRGRLRIESMDGGTRVTIGPPRGGTQWFNLFVVTFAFGPIALFPSVALSAELISGHEHFHAAFLAMLGTVALFFVLFFAFFLLLSLWDLFGDEVIALNGEAFTITDSLFGRQFVRRFAVDRISAFRLEARTYKTRAGGVRIRGVITFDHGGKKVDAQRFVSGEEGRALLEGSFCALAAKDSKIGVDEARSG